METTSLFCKNASCLFEESVKCLEFDRSPPLSDWPGWIMYKVPQYILYVRTKTKPWRPGNSRSTCIITHCGQKHIRMKNGIKPIFKACSQEHSSLNNCGMEEVWNHQNHTNPGARSLNRLTYIPNKTWSCNCCQRALLQLSFMFLNYSYHTVMCTKSEWLWIIYYLL